MRGIRKPMAERSLPATQTPVRSPLVDADCRSRHPMTQRSGTQTRNTIPGADEQGDPQGVCSEALFPPTDVTSNAMGRGRSLRVARGQRMRGFVWQSALFHAGVHDQLTLAMHECACVGGGGGRGALERKAPQRRPQKRLGRRLEEVAKAVGGGYCRLQMPLMLALAMRGTVAGHRPGALEGVGGTSPSSNASLAGGGGAGAK